MAEEEKKVSLISYKCPSCGAIFNAPQGQSTVKCPACVNYFNPLEVKNKPQRRSLSSSGGESSGGQAFANAAAAGGMIQGIQNAESAFAYASALYDEMDWEDYQENSYQYRIDSVADLVDEIRITCSNNKLTYLLEFDSYVVPYTKKIQGIDLLVEKMIKCIDETNETDVNSYFTVRQTIIEEIQLNKESILKKLNFDLEQYQKYGADKEEVAKLKERLEEFEKLLDGLVEVKEMNEIPAVQKHYEERDKKIGEELLSQGILVQQEYERAVQLRSEGKINACLNILTKLKGYKDSNMIIAKENEFFDFDDYFEFVGKPYYYKKEQRFKDVVGKDKKVTRQLVGETDNLYEIVDGKPGKEPVLKDLTQILCRYGSRLLYLNINNEIKMFDFSINEDFVIDATKSFETTFKYKYIDKHSSMFAYQRRNSDRSSSPVPGESNEFEMAEIRLSDATPTVDTLFRFSKITYQAGRIIAYKNKIFVEEQQGKKTIKKSKLVDNQYDFETRRTRRFLDRDAHVTHEVGDYLYYVRYNKTPYNRDLYRFDLREADDQEEKLIRHNIFDVLDVDENKVFYTVGCETFNTFYSYNIETGEVIELFKNVTDKYERKGGYFFLTKSDKYNSFYFKIKEDGSRRILLATNFEDSRGMKNGYFYYIDDEETLKRVRLDGSDEQTLLYHYNDGNIMRITDSRIYCSLHEDVDIEGDEVKQGYSIISFDTFGHKLEKHIFNIKNGMFKDDDNIIYSTYMMKKYKIKNPDKNMNPLVERPILTYYKENIRTNEKELLFTAGLPEGFKEPRGCFKKKSDPLIFEEIVEEKHYD